MERVAFLYDPELRQLYDPELQYLPSLPDEADKASRAFALRTTGIPFRNAVGLVRGIDAFAAEPDRGLVIAPHVTANYRATINTLAIQYRLPTIYATRRGWEGGLIFTERARSISWCAPHP